MYTSALQLKEAKEERHWKAILVIFTFSSLANLDATSRVLYRYCSTRWVSLTLLGQGSDGPSGGMLLETQSLARHKTRHFTLQDDHLQSLILMVNLRGLRIA